MQKTLPLPGAHWSHAAPWKPDLHTHAVLLALETMVRGLAQSWQRLREAGPPTEKRLDAHRTQDQPPVPGGQSAMHRRAGGRV